MAIKELTTTIQVKRSTKERLDALGKKGDTYDMILERVLNVLANSDKARLYQVR